MSNVNTNSTTPPNKVPSANASKYPVQYGSAALGSTARNGNQIITEKSGNSDVIHQASVDDPVSESKWGENAETSHSLNEIGTPQNSQYKTAADGSPVPNQKSLGDSGEFPMIHHRNIPDQYYARQYVPQANSFKNEQATQINPGGNLSTNSDRFSDDRNRLFGGRQQNHNSFLYTFPPLYVNPENPNAVFTLWEVKSSYGYNSWVKAFCKELRIQGLGHLLPTENGESEHYPTDNEEFYITNIHVTCVHPKYCPTDFEKISENVRALPHVS